MHQTRVAERAAEWSRPCFTFGGKLMITILPFLLYQSNQIVHPYRLGAKNKFNGTQSFDFSPSGIPL